MSYEKDIEGMEIIERTMDYDELVDYVKKYVDEDDYVEVYFGRAHVEGTIESITDTHYRIDTHHDSMGLLEFDLKDVEEDLLEFVHIPESETKRIVISIL
ncbi:DUF2097 domain-containing protein [Methanococcus voltae]|uniref:Uncharacterized protein n=2 Tax=Methanococcus voltae TaxID=2188 RepID=A0A8J7S1D8_METVO|nr:DUF2097 family protein [Methanococcus voltae]MBP2172488.1 hypothetical protein [Methanococcus voltae]MBP2201605.1 hypothetical protein [Methanococcus voltae]MCS3922394.1 hypothetical protein [Methanococcus voltae PS]